MSRKRIEPELAALLRRSAGAAIGASGAVILDRARIKTLAGERRARLTLKAAANSDLATNGATVTHQTIESAMTPDTAAPINTTVITGMTIGGAQTATFDSLDKHNAAICECQNCPLGATRTNFVYGVGSPQADLMFIGEAPGKNEDEQGEPFVGRAGKLLDKILEAIDMQRSDVYIANILKCRPPANRDPQPAEMEQCFPYLKEQIAIIRPKILCALGRISAQALLDTTIPLGKLRGMWHSYQGTPLRVTYHPAALLRNPNFKRGCWEDMQNVRDEYRRLLAEAE